MTSFFPVRLAQPDRRTCGPSVLVALAMLESPGYAERILRDGPARFADEVRAVHRVTNRALDWAGRIQLPWTRALGTAPWALARHVNGRVRYVLPHRRRAALDWLVESVGRAPTPVYVGNRWSPRHVVLAVAVEGEAVSCYEPASGNRTRFTTDQWLRRELQGCGGWRVPWAVVIR